MTVTNVHKDPDALTMAITVELDATVERAWQLWADPRQLERWWGPPGYPATFVDHVLTVGSRGVDLGQFWLPAGLSISDRGDLYVCDSYNRRVQVFHITERDADATP